MIRWAALALALAASTGEAGSGGEEACANTCATKASGCLTGCGDSQKCIQRCRERMSDCPKTCANRGVQGKVEQQVDKGGPKTTERPVTGKKR